MLVFGRLLCRVSVVLETPASDVISALDECFDVAFIGVPNENLASKSGRHKFILDTRVVVDSDNLGGVLKSFQKTLLGENVPHFHRAVPGATRQVGTAVC